MRVKEYSLKFTKLSMYAPTMVADSRAKMNKFVIGIFDLAVNEGRPSILIHSMDMSSLMLYEEKIEE